MIIEWLYGIWEGFSVWILGLIPAFPVVGMNVGLAAILNPVSDGLAGLGGWIPWDVVNILLPISVSLYIGGLILRAVKSLIPMISG